MNNINNKKDTKIYKIDLTYYDLKKHDDKINNKIKETESYSENFDKMNKQNKEKYYGYLCEFIIDDFFKEFQLSDKTDFPYDFKYEKNGKTIYIDLKNIYSWRDRDVNFITKFPQKYNNNTKTSKGFCKYIEEKQVKRSENFLIKNNIDFKNFYYCISYLSLKDKKELIVVFSKKGRMDNILKWSAVEENPFKSNGSSISIKNYIISDIYENFEIINIS